MMDGKGFFLGLIAAVVLFLLWKQNAPGGMTFNFPGLTPANGDGSGGGCTGCAGPDGCAGCGNGQSPSYASGPSAQASMYTAGTSGFVTPGTPPLQTTVGSGSFYAMSGPTPDNSFTNVPGKPVSTQPTVARTQTVVHNVVGSASTPANIVPTRAVGVVPGYNDLAFHQHYNVAGVPLPVLRKMGYLQ